MMIFYNGDSESVPWRMPIKWKKKMFWSYLYGPLYPSACEWIVPGTYEAFE